jgi:hypothetical protein
MEVPAMRSKNENRPDWRFTMEHMGRELRKLYPPADTPPGWHDLFKEEHRRASRHDQQEDSKDDYNKM